MFFCADSFLFWYLSITLQIVVYNIHTDTSIPIYLKYKKKIWILWTHKNTAISTSVWFTGMIYAKSSFIHMRRDTIYTDSQWMYFSCNYTIIYIYISIYIYDERVEGSEFMFLAFIVDISNFFTEKICFFFFYFMPSNVQ